MLSSVNPHVHTNHIEQQPLIKIYTPRCCVHWCRRWFPPLTLSGNIKRYPVCGMLITVASREYVWSFSSSRLDYHKHILLWLTFRCFLSMFNRAFSFMPLMLVSLGMWACGSDIDYDTYLYILMLEAMLFSLPRRRTKQNLKVICIC